MARKRYKLEEIVAKLRQVDVLVSQGHPDHMPGHGRTFGVVQRAAIGPFRLACARSKQLRPRSCYPPVCIKSCGVRRLIRGHGCLSSKYGRRSKHILGLRRKTPA